MKLFYLLYLLALGLYAGNQSVDTQKISRFIDTKEEYGKFCEEYQFIPASQRLSFIYHSEFLLGDILKDTVTIPFVEEALLGKDNSTICNTFSMDVSQYSYEEELEYLSDAIVTIQVYQYRYGAGAAHGNGHISHYVYDREYGMVLNWENIFSEDKTFDDYIIERVIEEIAEKEFIDYFKSSKRLLNYRHLGYFSIYEEGLLIQYGKYEIASGAAGLPSLVVPKEMLKEYMKPGMYEKCFGKDT